MPGNLGITGSQSLGGKLAPKGCVTCPFHWEARQKSPFPGVQVSARWVLAQSAGLYCSCYKGYGSVAQIRAALAGRCRVASRLRQRPKNCRLNCCASMHNPRKRTCCVMPQILLLAEV